MAYRMRWRLILLYIVLAVIVYAVIYYVVFGSPPTSGGSGGGGYGGERTSGVSGGVEDPTPQPRGLRPVRLRWIAGRSPRRRVRAPHPGSRPPRPPRVG